MATSKPAGKPPPARATARLHVEYRSVAGLIPYARNSRTHDDAQVAQIAASIREFGWTNPVLIDGERGIIAGHGRVLAARKLGLDEAPCIELAGLSEAQRRAYVIADNQIALRAGWDSEFLAVEIDELRDLDFDLTILGFDPQDLNELIGTPNDAPEAAAEKEFGYQEKYAVLIDCKNEAAQAEAYEKLMGMGYACKVLVN